MQEANIVAPAARSMRSVKKNGTPQCRQLRDCKSAHIVANQARNRVATRQAMGIAPAPAFRVPRKV